MDERTGNAAAESLMRPKMVANPKGTPLSPRRGELGSPAPKGLPYIFLRAAWVSASTPSLK